MRPPESRDQVRTPAHFISAFKQRFSGGNLD
jgi:hypothetical protein